MRSECGVGDGARATPCANPESGHARFARPMPQAVTVHTAGAGRGGAPHDCPGSLSGPKSARKDPDASSSLNHAGTPAPRSRRASRNGGSVPGPTPLQSPGSALDPACMGFTAATSRPAPRRPEGSRGGGGGLGGPGSAGHGPPRPPRGNRGGADAFLSVRGFDSSLSAEPSRNEGTFPRPPKVPFFPKTGRGEPCLLGQVRTPRTRKAPGQPPYCKPKLQAYHRLLSAAVSRR